MPDAHTLQHPTWRIRVADAAGREVVRAACATRDGAIASVSPFDEVTVIAIECSTGAVEPVRPQSALRFRLANVDAVESALVARSGPSR